MRMRKKPWAEEDLAKSPYIVKDGERRAGKWRGLFQNNNPLHIEIGMGKGQFIIGKAKIEPNINFVGIERHVSVLAAAAKKLAAEDNMPPNIRIILSDAGLLTTMFAENEVSRIYINFCDPWPKHKYEKRRLTHGVYLKSYERILKDGEKLCFKTDNAALYLFSVKELADYGWKLETTAIRSAENLVPEGARQCVMSEYEQKFMSQGTDIYEITASSPILQSALNVL